MLFTIGLFSVADALLDMPMADVLETLPFTEEIQAALLRHEGPKGELLASVTSYERGEFPTLPSSDARPTHGRRLPRRHGVGRRDAAARSCSGACGVAVRSDAVPRRARPGSSATPRLSRRSLRDGFAAPSGSGLTTTSPLRLRPSEEPAPPVRPGAGEFARPRARPPRERSIGQPAVDQVITRVALARGDRAVAPGRTRCNRLTRTRAHRPRSQRPRVAEHRDHLARPRRPAPARRRPASRPSCARHRPAPPAAAARRAPARRSAPPPAGRATPRPPGARPGPSAPGTCATGHDEAASQRAGQLARGVEPSRAAPCPLRRHGHEHRVQPAQRRREGRGHVRRHQVGHRQRRRGTSAPRPAAARRPGRPSAPTRARTRPPPRGTPSRDARGNPHRAHPGRSHGSARTHAAHRRSSARTSARRHPGHDGGATSASNSANTRHARMLARKLSRDSTGFVTIARGVRANSVRAGAAGRHRLELRSDHPDRARGVRVDLRRALADLPRERAARARRPTAGSRCGCSGSRCCSSR